MIHSRSFSINGTSQWLYLNLAPKPKKTLLFIHGGPGWSDAPWAGIVCQRLWGELNTVHWDQRGCNRSFAPFQEQAPLTIDQMVQDGLEVCRVLRDEFQIHRPILVGHSWGAFLSVLMASQAPELFHSYIGIGQLIANHKSEPLSLAYCKRKAQELGRLDLLAELNAMPGDFYRSISSLFRQREIVSQFGGEFLNPIDQNRFEQWMLESPESYRSDWTKLYESCKSTCNRLWPELIERSLIDEVQRLDLPVTVLQGRQDYCTPTEHVVEWMSALSCSGQKELIQFEHSAHWPQIEENEKFAGLIFKQVNLGK
jgi:pimeloyl-ACP methyl ester carboxylesterase